MNTKYNSEGKVISKKLIKSFLNKNRERILIKFTQKFDGMDDSITSVKEDFKQVDFVSKITFFKNTIKYYKKSKSDFFLKATKEDKLNQLKNRYQDFLDKNLGILQKPFLDTKLNFFDNYETESHKGYIVSNFVNSFILAVKK